MNGKDILDRAFVNLILSDRATLEFKYHEGKKYSRADRETNRLDLVSSIFEERHLSDIVSAKEKEIVYTPVECLAQDVVQEILWQYETIPILLWCIGMYPFPKFTGKACTDNFHFIIGKHRSGGIIPEFTSSQPSIGKIELMRKVAMLWHWRSVEAAVIGQPWKVDADVVILSTFGEEYRKSLDYIPLTKTKPRDFIIDGKALRKLTKKKATYCLFISQWQHHALEWVLSDVSWDIIDINT